MPFRMPSRQEIDEIAESVIDDEMPPGGGCGCDETGADPAAAGVTARLDRPEWLS